MLEDVTACSRDIDYRVLDELNSEDCEQAGPLKAFLNSLEVLGY